MTDTATITTTAEAQRHLDELQAEQRNIGATITAARRAGDVSAVMVAEQRREDLPREIRAAQIVVLHDQLEQAWAESERLAAEEATANAAHEAASQAFSKFRKNRTATDRTPEQRDEDIVEQGRLGRALMAAENQHRRARHATALALAQVEDLEAQLIAAGGELPEPGDGLRAPVRPLAANMTFYDPRTYNTDASSSPGQQNASPIFIEAGETPPRWAAHEIADHPTAWTTT